MPIPEFVLHLREKVGTDPLWLSGAAAVVLRSRPDGHDEVLLVQRSDNQQWTVVTGVIDPGEEPAVTARRECWEETRVVVRADRLVWVSVLPTVTYPNGDVSQYLDLVFRCSWVSGEGEIGDDESIDVRWFALDDLPPLNERNRQRIAYAVANNPETVFAR